VTSRDVLYDEDTFDRWNDEIKAKIKSKLLESAREYSPFSNIQFYSRFRLASQQISELRDCHNEDELEGQLQCLPHDSDGVYDRIMSGIKRHREDSLMILQWLSFSPCRLKLAEVAQVTGVVPDTDQGLRFEPSRWSAFDMFQSCHRDRFNISLIDHVGTVKPSYLSVKEYLHGKNVQ
jgi:hypothetical protein